MDHALRTISYIADIGELVVIMARRRILPQDGDPDQVIGATPKMICHVFESEEVRLLQIGIEPNFKHLDKNSGTKRSVEYLDSNFIRTMLDYVRLNFFCYMIFKGLCLVNSHHFQALIGLKLKCAFSYSEVQSTNLVWIFRPEIEPRFFGLVLLIGYPKT